MPVAWSYTYPVCSTTASAVARNSSAIDVLDDSLLGGSSAVVETVVEIGEFAFDKSSVFS